jgi:hypothetical protein
MFFVDIPNDCVAIVSSARVNSSQLRQLCILQRLIGKSSNLMGIHNYVSGGYMLRHGEYWGISTAIARKRSPLVVIPVYYGWSDWSPSRAETISQRQPQIDQQTWCYKGDTGAINGIQIGLRNFDISDRPTWILESILQVSIIQNIPGNMHCSTYIFCFLSHQQKLLCSQ